MKATANHRCGRGVGNLEVLGKVLEVFGKVLKILEVLRKVLKVLEVLGKVLGSKTESISYGRVEKLALGCCKLV